MGDSMVNLHGGIGWRHAAGDVTPTSDQIFQSGGPLFTVAGVPIAKDTAALEAGLDTAMGQNGSFSLSYSGQMGNGLTDHGVKATMRWTF